MAKFTNIDAANRQIERYRKWMRWYGQQLDRAEAALRTSQAMVNNTLANLQNSPRSWDRPSEEWLPTFERLKEAVDGGLECKQDGKGGAK